MSRSVVRRGRGLSYKKIIAICHGKSERIFCESLRSNLRLPMIIESRKGGESSIQVAGLLKCMQQLKLHSHSALISKYPSVHYENRLVKANIFPIMDLDDCPGLAEAYMSGTLFDGHPLKELIAPVYNQESFDATMTSMGYVIDPRQKVKCYQKIFPGLNGDAEAVRDLYTKLKACPHTNLSIFIERCAMLAGISLP